MFGWQFHTFHFVWKEWWLAFRVCWVESRFSCVCCRLGLSSLTHWSPLSSLFRPCVVLLTSQIPLCPRSSVCPSAFPTPSLETRDFCPQQWSESLLPLRVCSFPCRWFGTLLTLVGPAEPWWLLVCGPERSASLAEGGEPWSSYVTSTPDRGGVEGRGSPSSTELQDASRNRRAHPNWAILGNERQLSLLLPWLCMTLFFRRRQTQQTAQTAWQPV